MKTIQIDGKRVKIQIVRAACALFCVVDVFFVVILASLHF